MYVSHLRNQMEGENISEFLAILKTFPLPVGWVTLNKKLSRCHFGCGIRKPELRSRLLSTVHTKDVPQEET